MNIGREGPGMLQQGDGVLVMLLIKVALKINKTRPIKNVALKIDKTRPNQKVALKIDKTCPKY